jgi:hypothetical protein
MIEAINKRLNEYLGFDNKELYIDPLLGYLVVLLEIV